MDREDRTSADEEARPTEVDEMPRADTERRAEVDDGLVARVVATESLEYTVDPSGEDAAPHVRAASAICGVGSRLAIFQDDANWLGLVDLQTEEVRALALPPGPGGVRLFSERRGNKHEKMDLEACVVVERGGRRMLIGFGSGSLAPRERIVRVSFPLEGTVDEQPDIDVVDARSLYARLRADTRFAGSELNVEGAALAGEETVRLFNRGNGAPAGDLEPVDATCDLSLQALLTYLDGEGADPPAPRNVVQYDLGELGGTRLTFTDATALGDDIVFLAAAEDSPDAVRDGPVAGSVVGIIKSGGRTRWTPLAESADEALPLKAEAIWIDEATPRTAHLVGDADDIDRPAELLTVELEGGW